MKQLAIYLNFDGACAEAMQFYERIFGGKIGMMMTFAGSPMASHAPPGMENRVMHARLDIGNQVLMASDTIHDCPDGMRGFKASLSYDTVAEGKPVFDALADGGKVEMPMQETFWSEGFGMVTDRFGTPWMVNCGMKQL